jgi:gliding motility-associated lipoprotein GldD
MSRLILFTFVIAIAFVACKSEPPPPRPRAYPRIEFPDRSTVQYDTSACPFTFRYPGYAVINEKKEACWFDLYMPGFEARLHCSYVPVTKEKGFTDLVRDAFVIAGKINERANYMTESRVQNAHGAGGLILDWTGPAASPVHFYLSDTIHHFFKAALYFDARVQPDSLAPIVEFIKQDIDSLIATFEWRD